MKRILLILLLAGYAAERVDAQTTDLSGLKFCIDPGHGGHNPANDRHVVPDPGTDFWESESNFQKALLLKTLLEAHGATVILTRNTNDYPNDADEPSLSARWGLANANNVDWFHSIHSNASGLAVNTSANYTLVLVKENIPTRQPAFPAAVTMSNLIGPAIQRKNRDTPRGTYTYLDYTFYGGTNGGFNLGVLIGLAMPGELSEGSFHDYFPETRRLMNNSYRKMETYGLLEAFLTYFGAAADSGGIIAGIQTNVSGGAPVNGSKVRLLPSNTVYTGDNYNNGFYMFDGLQAGNYRIRFETPGYAMDSVDVSLVKGATMFADRSLSSIIIADTIAPVIVNAFPGTSGVVLPYNQIANFTFSELLNQVSTLSSSGNFAFLENGVSEIAVLTKYWKNGNRSGVDIWPIEGLKPGKQYTVRVQNAKDVANNTLSSPFSVNFSTLANSFDITTVDNFNVPLSSWLPPDSNSATEGIVSDSTAFAFSAGPVIPALVSLPSGNTGSATLKYGWNTTDTSWLIHVALRPGTQTPQWTSKGAHVQVYLNGDGGGTLFRFVVDDSVDVFPNGTPTNHEVSRWVKVDWIGWRLVDWDMDHDSLGQWVGNGKLEGSLRLNGFQFMYDTPSSSEFGQIFLDQLQIAKENPTSVADHQVGNPEDFRLFQNYPNPFNPTTAISYQLSAVSSVSMKVFDMLGREVAMLANGREDAGMHRVHWNAGPYPSGIYFYKLCVGNFRDGKKMVLLK